LKSPCEFGIEPLGSISHGVNLLVHLEEEKKEDLEIRGCRKYNKNEKEGN
jgi:hypothetical protein